MENEKPKDNLGLDEENLKIEDILSQIEVEIRVNLNVLLDPVLKSIQETIDPDKYQEFVRYRTENLLQREFSFVRNVIKRVIEAGQMGNVLILFDIDETIVGRVDRENDEIRPAFVPLVKILKEQSGADIGIITTRGNQYLLDQLHDPRKLAPIASYFNPNHIYSTEGSVRRFAEDYYGYSIDSISAIGPIREILGDRLIEEEILDKQKVTVFDVLGERQMKFNAGDVEKLATLRKIRKAIPATQIVVVDDDPYPNSLNPKAGFYGVPLMDVKGYYRPIKYLS